MATSTAFMILALLFVAYVVFIWGSDEAVQSNDIIQVGIWIVFKYALVICCFALPIIYFFK